MKKLKIDPIIWFSHELKTPLSSLKLAIHLLKKKTDLKTIDLMEQEIDHMIHLVCNHLDVQMLHQEIEMKFDWHSVDEILSKVLNRFQLLLQKKNLKVKLNSHINCEAYIDDVWFHQVFENLLSNAVKFAPNRSTINIHYELQNKGITYSIHNKFQHHSLGHLKSTKLGLQIVQQIIEHHKGSFQFQKNKQDFRVSFWIPKAHPIKKTA